MVYGCFFECRECPAFAQSGLAHDHKRALPFYKYESAAGKNPRERQLAQSTSQGVRGQPANADDPR
jgi:hypothetical protein